MRNFEIAAQNLNSAVRMRWTQGHYNLGVFYKNGFGEEKCHITAKNFQYGTHAGIPTEMYELGWCYGEVIGVEKDPLKAVEFVKQSVVGKNTMGYALHSWDLLDGHNVAINASHDFWLKK